MAHGGKRPGAGRPKGSESKVTVMLKEAILKAAEEAGGEGGTVAYLTAQAKDNPTAFLSLLGKVLPMQVGNADDEEFKVSVVRRLIVRP